MSIQSNFPSVRPSLLLDFASTKQLDSRITYTRASTATFYNGVTTAMAEQNLFTYSQEFDNAAWVKARATVTANSTTAPDGTSTADSFIETTDTGGHTLTGTISATGPVVYSVYAKANTRTEIALYVGGMNKGKYFNLSTGAVGGDLIAAPDSATITSVGSGWYRCSITINSGTASSAQIYLAVSGAFSYTGDGTSGVYIWGAQLEQRSAVSAYTATTTQAITNYIPVLQTAASGVARFDNNPTTGESLGLLIEESRTNLLTYSAEFDNAGWAKGNGTVTANTIVSPDGTLTGERFVSSASTAGTYIQQVFTSTAQAYTGTFYVKYAGAQFVQMLWSGAQSTNYANFDLVNGTVGTTTATSSSITSVGNSWYRISIVSTLAASAGAFNLYCIPASTSARATSYVGDGWSGIFIWGAQLEAGAFATSYIPTVASQVTRAADAASMTGTNFSSWYNQGEGSFYSFDKATANGQTVFAVTDGTTNNAIVIKTSVSAAAYVFTMVTNGTAVVQMNTGGTANSKYSYAYKFNDCAGSVDGGTVTTDTVATVPVVNQLGLGGGYGSVNLNGTINKIAYYPLRLSNTNLVALTS